MKAQRSLRNTPEKIWKKIRKGRLNQCWNWSGNINTGGYGQVMFERRLSLVHRLVYLWTFPGCIDVEAPKNSSVKGFVLHKCDNRICCNPRHLFVGSKDDNMKDMAAKGRSNVFAPGEGPRCKLTASDVLEIREARSIGVSVKQLAKKFAVSGSAVYKCLSTANYGTFSRLKNAGNTS